MKSLFHPNKNLSSLIDNRLSAKEAQKLQHHLAQCSHCKRLLEKMGALRQLMAQLPSVSVHEDFVGRVLALHQRRQADATFWVGFEYVPKILPQLALVLLLIMALLWNLPQSKIETSPAAMEETIAKVVIIDDRELISALNTDDQTLQFALNSNYENLQGDKK